MAHKGPSRRRYLLCGTVACFGIVAGCLTEDDAESTSEPFTLTATDQTGSGETVTVDEVSAERNYFVHAHYNDETASSDDFDAGTTQEELQIDLDPVIEEDVSVTIGIHAQDDEERFTGETAVDIEYTVE